MRTDRVNVDTAMNVSRSVPLRRGLERIADRCWRLARAVPPCKAWRRRVAAFGADQRGGAMLYMGMMALTVLTSVGGVMANYAWREAQEVEIEAALRASVSAVGQLLDRLGTPDSASVEAAIKDRVARFLDGLLASVDVDDDDISLSYEAASRTTRITVGGQATAFFDRLFGGGGAENATVGLPTQTVAVQLLSTSYELALAVDLTKSMLVNMYDDDGSPSTVSRLNALRSAASVVSEVVAAQLQKDPNSIAVAVVPFGPTVNVADTTGVGDTAGKRRYARMLIGAHVDTDAARSSTHHWVDTFHAYGTGRNMGELQSRKLPDFYLGSQDANGAARSTWTTTADWDLTGDEDIDVSGAAPPLGTWSVKRKDFWNGCVMARWGAYWHEDARPGGWDPDNPGAENWPARTNVAEWTPAGTRLVEVPLHLSDEPPAAASPNTRFTAYSWPDAQIARNADGQLHGVMVELLDDAHRAATAATEHTINDTRKGHIGLFSGYNDWSGRNKIDGGDGGSSCMPQAILPLTSSTTTLSNAIGNLSVERGHGGRITHTFPHLGIVWGLRALSPLWSDVWSDSGQRPLANCAAGETGTHCTENLHKKIVFISDGYSSVYGSQPGRIAQKAMATRANPRLISYTQQYAACRILGRYSSRYGAAMGDTSEGAFNNRFGAYVDSTTKQFTSAGLTHLVDTFDMVVHNGTATTAQKTAWTTALSGLTPWQLFRGHGFLNTGHAVDRLMAANLGLSGRPMLNDHICRRGMAFSPYGEPDDLVQVGGRPVAGVAPFTSVATTTNPMSATRAKQRDLADTWFHEACSIAGQRGVEIDIIFLGNRPGGASASRFAKLEECVDKAGGTANVNDVVTAPSQTDLRAALRSALQVTRELRFLES